MQRNGGADVCLGCAERCQRWGCGRSGGVEVWCDTMRCCAVRRDAMSSSYFSGARTHCQRLVCSTIRICRLAVTSIIWRLHLCGFLRACACAPRVDGVADADMTGGVHVHCRMWCHGLRLTASRPPAWASYATHVVACAGEGDAPPPKRARAFLCAFPEATTSGRRPASLLPELLVGFDPLMPLLHAIEARYGHLLTLCAGT